MEFESIQQQYRKGDKEPFYISTVVESDGHIEVRDGNDESQGDVPDEEEREKSKSTPCSSRCAVEFFFYFNKFLIVIKHHYDLLDLATVVLISEGEFVRLNHAKSHCSVLFIRVS